MNACAAIESLLSAFEKAGTTEYKAVRKALQDMKIETTLGTIGYDESGDPEGVNFRAFQVQDGVFVEVK